MRFTYPEDFLFHSVDLVISFSTLLPSHFRVTVPVFLSPLLSVVNARRTAHPCDLHFEIGKGRQTIGVNLNVIFSRIGNDVYILPSCHPCNFHHHSVLGSFAR